MLHGISTGMYRGCTQPHTEFVKLYGGDGVLQNLWKFIFCEKEVETENSVSTAMTIGYLVAFERSQVSILIAFFWFVVVY